jgi:hypothetical protein
MTKSAQSHFGENDLLGVKTQWFNPNLKTIVGLHGIEDLILGHFMTHSQTIQDGNVEYF